MRKIISICFTAIVLSVFACTNVFACTGVYVGKKASADGTVIIARSEDTHPCYFPKRLEYVNKDQTKGQIYKQVSNNFQYKLPNVTYSYNCLPNQTSMTKKAGRFASVANNEMGVSISATVTGYLCDEVGKADPEPKDGLLEEGLTDIVAASCKTAREGVELLADIVDEYGSSEDNIIMITDSRESWYMELYTGHQYAAVKLPEDMVAAFGNEFMLGDVEDYEEYIVSENFFKLPADNGFAEYDKDGHMLAAETYGGRYRFSDFAHLRTWYGHFLFAPSTAGKYEALKRYPLTFKADKKISVADVMEFYKTRYEGTEYGEPNNMDKTRVVGSEAQTSVHIIQTYDGLPADRCALTWFCMGQAEASPFTPMFSSMHEFEPEFVYDSDEIECNDSSAYYIIKTLDTLVANDRDRYKESVTEYWKAAEAKMISETAALMKESANAKDEDAKKAQEAFARKCERQVISDAKSIISRILIHMSDNTETLKYKYNYDTLTFSPEKRATTEFIFPLNKSKISSNYKR